MFSMVAKDSVDEGKRVLILAHRGELLQQAGRWSFKDANKLISIIAANGWRTPDRFEPATFVPEGGLH